MADISGMSEILNRKYKQMNSEGRAYGKWMKCELHIHTPASYDYKLIAGASFNNLTDKDVIEVALQEGFLSEEQKEHLFKEISIGTYQSVAYYSELANTPYVSFKEYLAYKLIAHRLYMAQIEVAIISDHNTIDGFPKLNYALAEYFRERLKGNNTHSIIKPEFRKC